MRILWYSATPECNSGYGNATRNMIRWLRQQGHDVAVATKHDMDVRFRTWNDIPIVSGTNIPVLNREIMDGRQMDVCISMFDVWILEEPIKRHVPWIPVDTENINEKIINKTRDCPMRIAMSEHGRAEIEKNGLDCEYSPIGFDPKTFYPKPEQGMEFRKSIFPETNGEIFLIGSVGINYPGDRKGYLILMQAFKKFHENHPEARLYLHTTANKKREGINYAGIAMHLGIDKLIAWPHQDRFWFGGYDEEVLSEIYSGFDVFCLPTYGEGFGMPVVEAQACGTPVIVSANTSGPQLCQTGWLIPTHWDDAEYLGSNVWRYPPRASEVLECLENAYAEGGPSDTEREEISALVSEYRWENVWQNHWTPIMAKIEDIIQNERKSQNNNGM